MGVPPHSPWARLPRRRPLARRALLPLAVGGLVLGLVAVRVPSLQLPVVLLGCLAPLLLLAHRRAGSAVVIVVLCAALGWVRGTLAPTSTLGEPARRLPRLVLTGTVESLARVADDRGGQRHRLVLRLTDAPVAPGGPVPGDGLRLSIGEGGEVFRIGDGIRARLAVRRVRGFCNQGVDRWGGLLESRGVQWTAWESSTRRIERRRAEGLFGQLGRFRGEVGALIDRAAPGPPAAVLRAVLLGDTGQITHGLRSAFVWTGTVHLLAVSGLHLAMVVAGVFLAVRWTVALGFAARVAVPTDVLATPIALAGAVAFTLLTGGQVATRRALVMGLFAGVGRMIGRRAPPLHALWAAVGGLTLVDPAVLTQVGFQFSVAAVAGILLVLGRGRLAAVGASGGAGWARPVGRVKQSLCVGFAAWSSTAPLTAWHFGALPIAGIVASPVLTPLLGGAALGVGLPGVFLAPWPSLARPFLEGAGWIVAAGLHLAEAVASRTGPPWPLALIDVRAALGWTLAALACCAPPGSLFRRISCVAASFCLGLSVLGFLPEPRGLRVSFLDVGQGDAMILEEMGGGPAFVVDGGGLGGRFDPGDGVVLPGLRSRRIGALAAIVLTHPDRDHYGGLGAVAGEVTASEFWSTGATSQAEGFAVLLDVVRGRGLTARKLAAGDLALRGGEGMAVEVLHPPATTFRGRRNDGSLVLGVRFGATRVLLAGDLERRGERALLRSRQNLGATILKVPHHGSATSSTEAFVQAVRPATAIASLGANNAWGFPARSVLERYERGGALFATTADLGEIVLETDGQLETLSPCRPPGLLHPEARMGPDSRG